MHFKSLCKICAQFISSQLKLFLVVRGNHIQEKKNKVQTELKIVGAFIYECKCVFEITIVALHASTTTIMLSVCIC